jgi:hypothetical protein
MIKDDFFELFVDFFLFSEDDFSFSFDGRGLELAVLQDVGDDVNAGGCILFETAGVVNGLLSRCVGVQVCSHILDLQLELCLTAGSGALKSAS